jgi:hypothetical protein
MPDYDVIVCGGGPSGIGAAVAAARKGRKVLLVERYGFLGGMATSALVQPFCGHQFINPADMILGSLTKGIFKEVVRRLHDVRAYGSVLSPSAFDEERLKTIYDEMTVEAGVETLFHTSIIGAEVSGSRISHIRLTSKEGERKVSADMFIDATGDGDVAAFAGCPFTFGRSDDGLAQAMTTSFRMAGVDKSEMRETDGHKAARRGVNSYFLSSKEKGELIFPHRDFIHFYDYPRPDVLHFNMTRINRVSGLAVRDLTAAEMEGRRQAYVIADWLRETVPAFSNAYLEKLACQVGVRETRHVDGEYTVDLTDIRKGTKFSDGIARSCYFADIHSPTGSGFVHERTDADKSDPGQHKSSFAPPEGDWYEVPYRSILPHGCENLLVCCRALSATHEGSAAVRVMATMTATGEAAGIAASRAVEERKSPHEIEGGWVRSELGYLDEGPDYDPVWRATGDVSVRA